MTRLFVMVSRKVQPRSYHTNGAACGLRREIPLSALDNPDAFVREIRASMGLCEIAVEEELARLAAAHPAPQTETLSSSVNGRDQLAPPATRAAPAARRFDPPPADNPNGYQNGQADDEDDADENAPADGRQLLGWARKQTPDLKSWVISWGYKTKTKGSVIEWPEAKVTQCYIAANKALAEKHAKAR